MSRVPMFNSPLLLGFDQLERTLERLAKNAEGYPPYNIERIGENGLRITLAVAGFTVRRPRDRAGREPARRCAASRPTTPTASSFIAASPARQFQRAFMLADGIEVTGARLDNGLLSIDLVRPHAEPRIRTIRIDAGQGRVRGEQHDRHHRAPHRLALTLPRR